MNANIDQYCWVPISQRFELSSLDCCYCRASSRTSIFLQKRQFLSVCCNYQNIDSKFSSAANVVNIASNRNSFETRDRDSHVFRLYKFDVALIVIVLVLYCRAVI